MQLLYAFLLSLAILGPSSSLDEPPRGNAKIGERCERDHNCIVNAFCRSQLTCLCEPYHAPSLDKGTCVATAGLICTEDATCRTMTNAKCIQGVCACMETFILDINNSSNCLSRPTMVNDRCQRNDDCMDAMDRAMCIDGKCRCINGHHFANKTGTCIQSRGIYMSCSKDYECYSSADPSHGMECKNGECVCRAGDPGCNKGASLRTVIELMAFTILALQVI